MSEYNSCESKEIEDFDLHVGENIEACSDTGLESFTFPKIPLSSTQVDKFITKVVQEQNCKITKDARAAIENLAQLFLTMTATVSSTYTKEHKHRHVVQKSDVKESLQLMGFGNLTERVSNMGLKPIPKLSHTISDESTQKEKKAKISRSKPSPYSCFIKSEMPALKKDFPTYRLGDLAKEASKRWHTLSAEEKAKFRE